MSKRSRQYSAYDVSSFLQDSVGRLVGEIESCAIVMTQEQDDSEREKLLCEIQGYMAEINEILR